MTTKKRRKVRLEKIEKKTIENIVEVEKAYRRYKAFSKAHNTTPQPKDVFVADYLKHQEPKIQAIKALISKFNDKKCPIINRECLEFRKLFAERLVYVNTERFALNLSPQEFQVFYNHSERCDSCCFYAKLHKLDTPTVSEFKECSQAEFEQLVSEGFEALRNQGDPLEEWESQRGHKTVDKEKVSAAIFAEYDSREQF